MTNDEARMTKHGRPRRFVIRVSSLFRHFDFGIRHSPLHIPKRRREQFLLLDRMAAFRARGGAGGAGAADAREGETVKEPLAQVYAQKTPGPHVLRLFLNPV